MVFNRINHYFYMDFNKGVTWKVKTVSKKGLKLAVKNGLFDVFLDDSFL